jgi:hypothetical protein
MKAFGAVLILIGILVVGVGFYRGWFVLSNPAPDAGSDKVNINLAADPAKVKQDAEIVRDEATKMTSGVTEGVEVDSQANGVDKSNGS